VAKEKVPADPVRHHRRIEKRDSAPQRVAGGAADERRPSADGEGRLGADADQAGARPVPARCHLRPLLRSHHSDRRQGGARGLGGALSRGHQRPPPDLTSDATWTFLGS
jgi:hypothetical protein